MRFAVSRNARGAFKFGEEGPNRFGAKWNAEVSRLNAVAGVEIEISLLSNREQGLDTGFIERPVEIVGVENANRLRGHRLTIR